MRSCNEHDKFARSGVLSKKDMKILYNHKLLKYYRDDSCKICMTFKTEIICIVRIQKAIMDSEQSQEYSRAKASK